MSSLADNEKQIVLLEQKTEITYRGVAIRFAPNVGYVCDAVDLAGVDKLDKVLAAVDDFLAKPCE